ncbi:MAG: 3-deoxy-D-manno-octulosonic acid transferase [Candidatus Binatia bacterium]
MRGLFVFLYRCAGAVAALATLAGSLVAGGEDARRLAERRGLWKGHREATGPWVWIHSASVGEAEIAVALARRLAPHLAGVRLVLSSMTPGGVARTARESGVESRFFPIDFAPFVKRILGQGPPLVFVAVETEIWPETLTRLADLGVPAAVVNARISDSSLPRYRRLGPLVRPLLARLARVCARDEENAARWISLGARPAAVEVTGNIKFDLGSSGETKDVPQLLRRDPGVDIVLAASTHEGEEALALDAFAGLRERRPGAVMVVAPRHPERSRAVADLAAAKGFAVASWGDSRTGSAWPAGADVLVLDRLGLLRQAYASADAAFVGGSAVEGPGGHNLLEAVEAGCPAAAGPHLGNVPDQEALLREEGALEVVNNVDDLTRFWLEAVERPEDLRAASERARRAVEGRRGALERCVKSVLGLIAATREAA